MPAPRPRRVGIKDVAAAAGVSPTTVSHALNGKGRVPEQTRERVREVARALGYRPSSTARNLLGGRTGMLGFTVPQPPGAPFSLADLSYFVELTNAATRTAMEHGYALAIAPGAGTGEPWAGIDIDGAIVADPLIDDPTVAALRGQGLPVVTSGRVIGAGDDGHWVDNDFGVAATTVLDHLHEQGADTVALLTTPPTTSYVVDMIAAYEQWCERHRTPARTHVCDQNMTAEVAAAAAAAVLAGEDRPDAVFAPLDRLALATLQTARTLGLTVPGDLLIAAATDSETARWTHPSLTVIHLHPEQVGRTAGELLIALVEGREPPAAHVIVPTTLIVRESSGGGAARPGA